MSELSSGWSREFGEPVALPDGRKLVVLRDAANYITAPPAKDVALPEWQAAIEALILVVELGGPTMFARIGEMRALNHGHVREFNPSRKEHHWGRRKLKGAKTKSLARNNKTLCGGSGREPAPPSTAIRG